jgi:hypothetical protein
MRTTEALGNLCGSDMVRGKFKDKIQPPRALASHDNRNTPVFHREIHNPQPRLFQFFLKTS